MLVEMFVGDICNHTDIKLAGVHTMLGPAMGSSLQHHMRQTGVYHFREITLHVMGIRCGDVEPGIQHFIPNDSVDG